MMNTKEFPVYVDCMTFNHATYIEDAMNGFTIQRTNFPYVCAIVDDASTDNTVEVINKFLGNNFTSEVEFAFQCEMDYGHLELVRHKTNENCWFLVVFLKENHYGRKDKREYLRGWRDKAKYYATCEGDDYWIDPNKLQEQYEFLENHSDYSLVYGRVYIYDQTQRKITGIHGRKRKTLRDRMMNGCFIPTCTILYRSKDWRQYMEEIKPFEQHWRMGDIPLFLYLGSKGLGKMLKPITTTYRLLSESASHSKDVSKVILQSESTRDVFMFFAEKYFPEDQKMKNRIQAAHLYRVFRLFPVNELPNQYKQQILDIKDNRGKTIIAKFIVRYPNTLKLYDFLAKFKMKILMRIDKK